LVAVDVQRGFVNQHTSHVLPQIQKLVESNAFDQIIATQYVNALDSPARRLGWNKLSTPQEQRIDPVLARHCDTVIRKTTYGTRGELARILDHHREDEITIAGIDTDVCVTAVATELFDAGFNVRVDPAACASNGGTRSHDSGITVLRRILGRDAVGI